MGKGRIVTIPDQIRRRGERALHNAAIAIQRGDVAAKIKFLADAEVCRKLLLEAGEPDLEAVIHPDAVERCSETEDMFE
jgi:hypothetical protein